MFKRTIAFHSVNNCSCRRKNMFNSSQAFFHTISQPEALCWSRWWPSHCQGGHFIESAAEYFIVVNAKDISVFLFKYFIWLYIMQRIYSQCSTSSNKFRGQRIDESDQSRMYSAVLAGDYVKCYDSFIIHSCVWWLWLNSWSLWNVKSHEQLDSWWMCGYIHWCKYHMERCHWGRISHHETPNWWQWHW